MVCYNRDRKNPNNGHGYVALKHSIKDDYIPGWTIFIALNKFDYAMLLTIDKILLVGNAMYYKKRMMKFGLKDKWSRWYADGLKVEIL